MLSLSLGMLICPTYQTSVTMIVSNLSRLAPLILILLSWPPAIDAQEYRFFQLNQKMFAIGIDDLQVWHVDQSGHKIVNGNYSSNQTIIQLNFIGPYELEAFDQLKINLNTQNGLKFVFVARFGERCLVLVLVDSELNYRGWRISINPRYFQRTTDKANIKPFRLSKFGENVTCSHTSISTNGNLANMAALVGLFGAKQTVTSVWSTDHHTKLYFVGTDRYIKFNLDQLNSDNGPSEDAVQMVSLNGSGQMDGEQTSMIYKNKYLFRVGHSHKEVCMVKSLEPMKFASKCTPLQYFIKPLNSILQRNIGLLGRIVDENDEITTAASGNNSILILVVILVVIVLIVIVVYVVAAKYFCQDSMAVIPFSGLNSKYVGKLRSTSSIKTLNSDGDVKSLPAQSKYHK